MCGFETRIEGRGKGRNCEEVVGTGGTTGSLDGSCKVGVSTSGVLQQTDLRVRTLQMYYEWGSEGHPEKFTVGLVPPLRVGTESDEIKSDIRKSGVVD